MSHTIENTIELQVPIERVWQAVTDHKEFGSWFLVKLENPFAMGRVTKGVITHPEAKGMVFSAVTRHLKEPTHFSFRWPYSEKVTLTDPKSLANTTQVSFDLEEIDGGTRLTITESGFEKLPATDRQQVIESNTRGWKEQVENIRAYLQD